MCRLEDVVAKAGSMREQGIHVVYMASSEAHYKRGTVYYIVIDPRRLTRIREDCVAGADDAYVFPGDAPLIFPRRFITTAYGKIYVKEHVPATN